ncbi:4'-phosphopantetheinyl transferase superfamily protein [Flavobacterium sp. FBOR7N2.3]|uniref:4'-phosphopantetheinyl transferase superfamily protein n=1 Tax=Flavobacterium magnesitis TaxID=3138077 RepID=A0ABV4TME5_9FLAO
MKNTPTAKLLISFFNIRKRILMPDNEFFLNENDIRIYSIYLPDFADLKSDLAEYLNVKELPVSSNLYMKMNHEFIIYRSILKIILAAYSKLDAKKMEFDYHLYKKPYLASKPWLHFNISHSEDYVVIAISRRNLGIDIEYIAQDLPFTNLIPEVFEEREITAIHNSKDKKRLFYSYWTRKEAFVKGLGTGINDNFKHIPCADGEHIIDAALSEDTKNWHVCNFNLSDHYMGAIACEFSSAFSKDIVIYTVPNDMNALRKMIND